MYLEVREMSDTSRREQLLDLFGGRQEATIQVVRQIKEARIRAGFTTQELAEISEFPASDVNLLLVEEKLPPSLNVICSLSALLGLAIERVLPMPKEKEREWSESKAFWREEMDRVGAGVKATAGGRETGIDNDATLSLFVRFRALHELCQGVCP